MKRTWFTIKDLKAGMMIKFSKRDMVRLVINYNTNTTDLTTCQLIPKDCNGFFRHYDYYMAILSDTKALGDIEIVYSMYGEILWEKPEEVICTIDGIEYSESTLKSIIKKANGM